MPNICFPTADTFVLPKKIESIQIVEKLMGLEILYNICPYVIVKKLFTCDEKGLLLHVRRYDSRVSLIFLLQEFFVVIFKC